MNKYLLIGVLFLIIIMVSSCIIKQQLIRQPPPIEQPPPIDQPPPIEPIKYHKAYISKFSSDPLKLGANFEILKNNLYIDVNNYGDFDESLTLICNSINYNIFVNKGLTRTFIIEYKPTTYGYVDITCLIQNQYISDSLKVTTYIQETEWHKYFRTLPSDSANFLGVTTNCDRNTNIIALKDSLTTDTPRATIQYYLTFTQKNIIYDYDMYNNIIINGYDYFFGKPTATKTLQDKRGICRHKTLLFTSLARARGIPTKIISVFNTYCNFGDIICYGSNTLTTLGLIPYNHIIAYVWLENKWIYVDPTSGNILGEKLPYYFQNPTILNKEPWGC